MKKMKKAVDKQKKMDYYISCVAAAAQTNQHISSFGAYSSAG